MRFEKGEKSSAKGGLELGSIALKSTRLTIYTSETDAELGLFLVLTNQSHLGGRS